MNKIFSFLLLIVLLASCNQYQKALKSDDVAVKTDAANKMYEAGKYLKAIRLYEQVAPAYKGKPQAERLFFMYSKSLYNTKQYYLAGYQFENFAASYPKSEKREEAYFLASECFYKLSPVYSLDQTDTEKALEKVQKFIDIYPNSEYLPKANAYVKELREKYNVPFIGIEPAIKPAALQSKTQKIGVLATKGTLNSDLFHKSIANHPNVEIIEQIGHGLVQLIENGTMNDPEMKKLLEEINQIRVSK